MDPLDAIFEYIDQKESSFIDELQKVVAIQSVSAWKNQRPIYKELYKMIEFIQKKLRDELQFSVQTVPLAPHHKIRMVDDDSSEEFLLPPLILAQSVPIMDPLKKTLLIYGHLDVQPAKLSDGWDSEPFILSQRDGALYGRGSTDDKGPVLGWLHALEAFKFCRVDLPLNIKMILESDEEDGSFGLEEALIKEKNGFLANIDYVVISDNYWLGKESPCLTHGLRGMVKFDMSVTGGQKDLHSGVHGGAIHEPIDDLIWMLGQLKDGKSGRIIIPKILDGVVPIGKVERQSYSKLDFSTQCYQAEIGCPQLLYPKSKEDTLMARWRFPSLSIHGIEGAFSDPGFKTVIPCRVVGKFSIRLVPHQDPGRVEKAVLQYLRNKWKERKSGNGFEIVAGVPPGRPWLGDVDHENYRAAGSAIRRVWGKGAQFTREGGSIPITLVLEKITEANVVLIPMGQSDDGAHSQNEKISIRNYIQGTKVFAAYFMELAKVVSDDDCEDE